MATKREDYIAEAEDPARSMERRDGEVGKQATQAQASMPRIREAAAAILSIRIKPRNSCARCSGLGRRLDGAHPRCGRGLGEHAQGVREASAQFKK